jgi:formate hydrogenlyase subunit 3/multisubunit Na+/H+ antiporter MnhD subunit
MVTTLSLTLYFGLIVLAPVLVGAIAYALGLAGRADRTVVLALGVVGAGIPAVALLFVIPAMALGDPIAIQPFGLAGGFWRWIIPTFRIDPLALYCGMGVTLLLTPLLLWLTRSPATSPATSSATEADAPGPAAATQVAPANARAVGLILALEALALLTLFADSLVIFGVAWLLVVATTWALGEVATDTASLDWPGLAAMAVGPLVWLLLMFAPAIPVGAPRWLALIGRGTFTPVVCILLLLALAVSGGAYPALAWVRRRAALSGPVGLAAVALAALPATLYAAGRTFTAAVGSGTHWPYFVAGAQPDAAPAPVTVGVVAVVLGTLTVGIAGLVALGRRDARALIALLAVAQVGWGLVAVGLGQPASVTGLVALLLSMVLGLGAMIAASVAGGALIDDMEVVEPEADGPRPVGAPLRLVPLLTWLVGAVTLLGVPLFAGYGPRQLISQTGLQVGGLAVPLVGLCWCGDALIALALLRAVAPAFQTALAGEPQAPRFSAADAPGAVLALLALVVGIIPGLVLQTVVSAAAESLAIPTAFGTQVHARFIGYDTALAQWPATIAWISVVALTIMLLAALPASARVPADVWRGGQEEAEPESAEEAAPADAVAAPAAPAAPAERLSDPAGAWGDLAPSFASEWTMPARGWLLAGIDDAEADGEPPSTDAAEDATPHDGEGAQAPPASEEVPSGNE